MSIADLALANARLHARTLVTLADAEQRAASDPLTGLANHRVFHERLRDEVERARRHRRPLALALIDLDHFKDVNDRHGHQVGDEVLRETAARLLRRSRPEDLVARIGGEEFAWLLPESDALDAWKAAERARETIAGEAFPGDISCTVSIGIAELAQATDAGDLVRLADGALYWAKGNGRNVSFCYSPEVVEVLSAEERAQSLERSQALNAIRALARAVDARDPSTRRHSERVADLSVRIAAEMGWPADRQALLREAALVHDVGKIGVSDAVLFKASRLTDAEIAHIQEHSTLGAQIVADVLTPEQVGWVKSLHERADGRGYPEGVRGDRIPDGARLLAVADAWDAMTSARPYTAPLSADKAAEECRREAGRQFDAEVVEALERLRAAGRLEDGGPAARRSPG
jgi:diguanylate cyclase (GGDEF)-like protein/putative nucleotidyltransferase with HDIG domain